MTRLSELDRGAIAALDLLLRGIRVSEGEETAEETAETIRGAIRTDGLAVVIRREIDFERGLSVPGEFSVRDTYGPFPSSLRRLAEPRP